MVNRKSFNRVAGGASSGTSKWKIATVIVALLTWVAVGIFVFMSVASVVGPKQH